jgi:HK97 gp10 family phage protein
MHTEEVLNAIKADGMTLIIKKTNELLALVKEECPVKTGKLKDSHIQEVREEDNKIIGSVSSDVDYAIYVNVGTHEHPSNPYMERALNKLEK